MRRDYCTGEKFFDELNNVRLLTLSLPIHARLGILETAISKMNRGQVSNPHLIRIILAASSPHLVSQGMGFLLGMTVINKAQLTAAGRSLISAIMLGSTYVLNLQSVSEVTADQCRYVPFSCDLSETGLDLTMFLGRV